MSGLALGDKIKAMYITLEGITSAGISTVAEEVNLEKMMERNQQNTVRSMERQAGGTTSRPTGAGG
ncbi:MAG: hypothetical protein LBD75_01060 [Candidatus Peribacteria bacterium]|nr:hypothetical protein [Candidatus Peribacteria bacterium]